MRALLASNSKCHGQEYLGHCEDAVREVYSGVKTILFIPYALADLDGYTAAFTRAARRMGFAAEGLHRAHDPADAVRHAEAFFTGGGNTFRLLHSLQSQGVMEPLRQRVLSGAPYGAASAGSNIACPTIMTTNDMPIVQPRSFGSLGLIPFQLNCHYLDPEPGSTHMGETRETRIREYHEVNDTPVLGLREGAWLSVRDAGIVLEGKTGARLFRPGQPAEELDLGAPVRIATRR